MRGGLPVEKQVNDRKERVEGRRERGERVGAEGDCESTVLLRVGSFTWNYFCECKMG